ncbi:MAG TPA: RNA methyltransferase [Candidatus Omnitrophica bacterium]|nr:MAG: hypothetical protein A2Z81_05025 [Omnitrophica WOR_2 bacterium GWA2_45_18]HBR14861.1 RNA methyltransferase [Candidatus Omnitrophota bacterium]
MPESIISLTNLRIKHLVKLRTHGPKERQGLTIVEGGREILRAFEAKVPFKELYVCREQGESSIGLEEMGGKESFIKKIAALKVPVFEVSKSVFAKISYGERREGLLALCAPRPLSLEQLHRKENPLYVIVETVEKPGNLGAILRTADGVGVDGVIVCDAQTDIYNPNVIRASLGTVFCVEVAVTSTRESVRFLKERDIRICAAVPCAKNVYSQVNMKGPLAIVLGSEQKGLSDLWASQADIQVRIPMKGKADSLNVSTAAAILLYEALRQRS